MIEFTVSIRTHSEGSATAEESKIMNPATDGEWWLDIEKIEAFQQKDSTGLIQYLRTILWFRYKYPCNWHFERVKSIHDEWHWNGHCKVCYLLKSLRTLNTRICSNYYYYYYCRSVIANSIFKQNPTESICVYPWRNSIRKLNIQIRVAT